LPRTTGEETELAGNPYSTRSKRLAEWVAVFCDGRTDQHPLLKADTRLARADC
jgi:hypothetical protein